MRENFREENVPTVIRAFLSFALIYYAYLYFFPFDQGASAAPAPIKSIKDLAYAGVGLALMTMLPWPRLGSTKLALLFVPFAFSLLITSALHSSHTGLTVQLWENIKNIGIFIPLYSVPFLLRGTTIDRIIKDVFFLFPCIGLLQCIFVILYHGIGYTLWEQDLYAGLIGNPNSFALFLNIAIACLLATLPSRTRKSLYLSLALIALFTWAILRTASGSQFAVLIFVLIYSAAFRFRHWKRYIAAIVVSGSVMSISPTALDQAMFSMKGAERIVFGAKDAGSGSPDGRAATKIEQPAAREPEGDEIVSRSVTLRRDNFESTIAVFSKGADDILFGDFDTPTYKAMDGQYFVLMFNGGLLTLLTFLLAAGVVYLYTLYGAWRTKDNHLLGLNLIIAAFGITFLASRVLMYFPFNFIFFLVAGLAVARATEVRR